MRELEEARELWEETKEMDIEAMKDKGRKSMKTTGMTSDEGGDRPMMNNLRNA